MQRLDEYIIDLRAILKIIKSKTLYIVLISSIIASAITFYIYNKQLIPIYLGTATIELEKNMKTSINEAYNIKTIIEKAYPVLIEIPINTDRVLIIKCIGTEKETIFKNIEIIINEIIKRDIGKVGNQDLYFKSQQIGKIEVSNTPLNNYNLKLVFVVALLISIFTLIILILILDYVSKNDN